MKILTPFNLGSHRLTRRIMVPQLALLSVMTAATPAMAERQYSAEEERNKAVVLDFYDKAFNQKDFAAASQCLGHYTQPIRM